MSRTSWRGRSQRCVTCRASSRCALGWPPRCTSTSTCSRPSHRCSARLPVDTEVLAGLELGGVPVATALSLETGLSAAFVRKEAKTYGTAKLAEGSEVAGRQVLIVEDVITTGGQVVSSTEQLRALGATVEAVLCVIDRSAGDHSRLDSIDLETISLFRAEDLA